MLRPSVAFALLPFVLACGTSAPQAPSRLAPTAATRNLGVATTPPPSDFDAKLAWVLAGDHRSQAARLRDEYRHPVETLRFFGLRDDMNVVEIFAGAGWYTDILAPLLAERGHLAVAGSRAVAERKEKETALLGKVEIRPIRPPAELSFGPAGSADMVLTFRNHHNWIAGGYDEQVFKAAFEVLKRGGVFGYVEHRAAPEAKPEDAKDTGYVPEAYARALAEKVGFRVEADSDINSNPRDTRDHPGGVWALPPTFRNGDKDRRKYIEIGESDRMTLKLVKP